MENPYQASIHGGELPTSARAGVVTPRTLEAMAGTRPWVRVCSITGFVFAGLMFLFGAFTMLAAVIGIVAQEDKAEHAWILALGASGYLVSGGAYLWLALRVWKYGSAIFRLMSSQSEPDLDQALDQQRRFWKLTVILILAAFVLLLLSGLLAFALLQSA